MDSRFNKIATDPANKVFQVVFFPDRIYHAQYLNATRSPRYRYNVREVRGKADINVLKGEVYLDGTRLSNFLRVEYRGTRLSEVAREQGRFLGSKVLVDIAISPKDGPRTKVENVAMEFCPWIGGFQVEFWETLEPPPGQRHDFQVLDLMGYRGAITRVPKFADLLSEPKAIKSVNLSFRESDIQEPSGTFLPHDEAEEDNFFQRNVQVPNTDEPSSKINTVEQSEYGLNFQRGWFIKKVQDTVQPVLYRNAMMNDGNRDADDANVIEMRWVLQQELGGTMIFFHEVTIPPHTVEGTHQHIGSEEVYYITEGRGIAYLGADDDPTLAANGAAETVTRDIFGLGPRPCQRVEVEPGSVIYTKSGGIHGIENPHKEPLRFVAFLYHSA